MATRRKPKAKKLKFELTKSAIAGIAVIAFCLFLWMFLLGVWAGQSVLLPSFVKNELDVKEPVQRIGPLVIRAEKKVVKKAE
jgi:multisubunit Na+/H+ antiporter MnhB subunit